MPRALRFGRDDGAVGPSALGDEARFRAAGIGNGIAMGYALRALARLRPRMVVVGREGVSVDVASRR